MSEKNMVSKEYDTRRPYWMVEKEALATEDDHKALYDTTIAFLNSHFNDFSFVKNEYGVIVGETFYLERCIKAQIVDKGENLLTVSFSQRNDDLYAYNPIGNRIGPVSPKYNTITCLDIDMLSDNIENHTRDPHYSSGNKALPLRQTNCIKTIELINYLDDNRKSCEYE